MKKFISLVLCICMILSTISMMVLSAGAKPPVVINNTWSAVPGEAVGIYGGNFGSDAKGVVLMLLPLDKYNGEEKPATDMYSLPILSVSDTVIGSVIPEDIEKGNYVLWVKTSAGYSKPFFINTPELDWLSEQEITHGMTSRLFGRNLLNPKTGDGTNAKIVLTKVGTDKAVEADITNVTEYTLDFIVPEGLENNAKYIVKYNNGASEYGWATLDDEDAVTVYTNVKKFDKVKEMFDLELAWADRLNIENVVNVKDLGLKGDGSDDSKAYLEALAKMKQSGGGILYFPKGEYNLRALFLGETYNESTGTYSRNTSNDKESFIPNNVIFMGDGMDKTILYTRKPIQLETRSSSAKTDSMGGMYNLAFISDIKRPDGAKDQRSVNGWNGNTLAFGGYNLHYFLKNVKIKAVDGSCTYVSSYNYFTIDNCDFDITHQGPYLVNTDNKAKARLINSTVKNTQRSIIWMGEHSWIENNLLIGDNAGNKGMGENNGATMEHRILESGGNELYFGNNTITGTIGDNRTDEQLAADGKNSEDNCGEGIANQAQCRVAYNTLTSATETTFTDDTRNWTDINAAVKAKTDYNNLYAQKGPYDVVYGKSNVPTGFHVAIIYGKGVGQIRKITGYNGTTLTIDKPWDIVPDKTSVYTIDRDVTQRYMIVNNDIQAEVRKGGIMFYCKSADNIVTGNKMGKSGGIWVAKGIRSEEKCLSQGSTPRADFSYYNYIANNDLSGGVPAKEKSERSGSLFIGPGTDGGTLINYDSLNSTTVYGNMYRKNVIHGSGKSLSPNSNGTNKNFVDYNGILITSVADAPEAFPFGQGNIVDQNTVTNSNNGVVLSNGSWDTLLYKNNFSGNGKDYNDAGVKTVKILPNDTIPATTTVNDNQKPIVNANDLMPAPTISSGAKVITLVIDSLAAVVNGENVTLDVPAKQINDRTLTPARFVAENLGATVDWDEDTKTVTITSGANTIILVIDSNKAMVNGEEKFLDVPAMVIDDRTLTPARFVAENLGATVDWDEDTKTVTITK